MKEIVVYFKGAAKVTISNWEYEVLHSTEPSKYDRVRTDIEARVAVAAERASISVQSYICKDDGEGEVRFD